MKAQLIGESSAGMTAVHIIDDNGNLVYSHRYFEDGATDVGYRNGLWDAIETMRRCEDYHDFDGCAYDAEDVVDFDDCDTTGIVIEYDSKTEEWSYGENPAMGQGREIVDALIISGFLEPDQHHQEYYEEDATVVYLVRELNE